MNFYEQTFLFFISAGVLLMLAFAANSASPQTQNSFLNSVDSALFSSEAALLFYLASIVVIAVYGSYWLTQN